MADENATKIGFGEEFDSEPEYELIDDGEYEFIISKVEPRESNKNGKVTKRLALTFKINPDVDQKFKGRCVFFTIFGKDNDPYYDYYVVNKIITTQLAKGEKIFLEGVDEVLQYLQNLKLVASVTSEFDDFRGEDRNVIVPGSFKPSQTKKATVQITNTENMEVVADDDLPWMQ